MVGNEDSRMFRNPQQRKTSQDVPFFLDAPVLTPLHSNQSNSTFVYLPAATQHRTNESMARLTLEETLHKCQTETYNWATKGVCETYLDQMVAGESVGSAIECHVISIVKHAQAVSFSLNL